MYVFFDERDREVYLQLLAETSARYGVLIIAYCLMDNHIHLIVVPLQQEALAQTLKVTHMRYSQYLNSKNSCTGHLWQQRYFSSPLSENYFWAALRYVERNPVEAEMTDHAANYVWSSAAAHCGMREDSLLTSEPCWVDTIARRKNYYQWLSEPEDAVWVEELRANTCRDLPSGEAEFLEKVEESLGVTLPKQRRKISA